MAGDSMEEDDRALAIIADAILEATDEEILCIARANGVDVNALTRKMRAMIAERLAAAGLAEDDPA